MYSDLYQFLIKHRELPLPGIGTFLLERKPATSDFYNKKINPPSYAIAFRLVVNSPSKFFFVWLGNSLNVSDRDAIINFNDFVFEMKKKINSGQAINWNGVGILSKGFGVEIKFVPATKQLVFDQPVLAEKVIREKVEHIVRVGEDEKTSTQMTEMLNQPIEKKSYWLTFALVAAFVSMIFIAWHLFQYGLNISSSANQKKLSPVNSTVISKTIQ